jgi:hypothetical protein
MKQKHTLWDAVEEARCLCEGPRLARPKVIAVNARKVRAEGVFRK